MSFREAMLDAPRWMLVMILIYAPWAYGCTWDPAVDVLNQFSLVLVLTWLAGILVLGHRPALPWFAVALCCWLVAQGAWMAWNAHSYHRFPTWTTVIRIWDHPHYPGAPGAIDRPLSRQAVLTISALLGCFVVACDVMRLPVWRKRLWWTMAATGISLAATGVALKVAGPAAMEVLWDEERARIPSIFATYRYHGNAASFLNLCWPLVLGFAFASFQRGRGNRSRTFWIMGLLIVLLATMVNTSRAGWFLAGTLLGVFGLRFGWAWWRARREWLNWRRGLIHGLLLIVLVGGMAGLAFWSDWDLQRKVRLNSLGTSLAERYPAKLYHFMLRESSLLGFGPGTFQVAFPPFVEALPHIQPVSGFWRHAHNDYYEVLFDWGWLGAVAWGALVFGGLGRGLTRHFRSRVIPESQQWVVGGCACISLGGVLLHAFWDFPLQIASLQLYFLILLAGCWARTELEPAKDPDSPAPASGR